MVATALVRTFLDTTILTYAFDDSEPLKQARSQELLDTIPFDSIVLSGQVLGEFYWTSTRKIPMPLTASEARDVVSWLSSFVIVPIDQYLARGAIDLGESAKIAYWDALIIKAAASMSCERVLTEDLNHGQVIDGVQIVNPFLELP